MISFTADAYSLIALNALTQSCLSGLHACITSSCLLDCCQSDMHRMGENAPVSGTSRVLLMDSI